MKAREAEILSVIELLRDYLNRRAGEEDAEAENADDTRRLTKTAYANGLAFAASELSGIVTAHRQS